MNKLITLIIIVAAIAIAWFILNPGDTFDYVVTVDNEITQLENELAELDAQVAAGTLTESEATEAKVRIITRLDAINTAATNSEKAQLTPEQRAQLVAGLDRLKVILVTYQDTLTTIEATADDTAVQARVRRGSSVNNSRHLNLIVADVINDVEETVQDSVQDYEPNLELDAEIDTVVEETTAYVEMAEETGYEEESMEEKMSEGSTEESASSSEEEMSDEPMIDVEASADAEVETEVTS